ncbi:Ig-like domain-containing protein [Hymenobacter sp. BT175]|uniref:beta strand repeat-containing protein n=1 Tax=Hymenobacter translucens TaxID=2886507 RepID=UPI001D0F162A|nr:Ig-like domain-containing protein [Hymenobacter translucens]MCC2547151.1 Ig-like domain-containing protein [Hymenobacter translucens]
MNVRLLLLSWMLGLLFLVAPSLAYSAPVGAAARWDSSPSPVITSPAQLSAVSTTTPGISGTSTANALITVVIDNVVAGTTNANSSGLWSWTVAVGLSQGSHTVHATATVGVSSPSPTITFRVDTVAPVVTAVTIPANATYTAGQALTFTVSFSETVLVTTNTGVPYLSLTVGSTALTAAYVSGAGTTVLTFRHILQPGLVDPDGVTLGSAITLNGGRIRDAATNNASLTLTAVPSTAGVRVDSSPPTVVSMSRRVPISATTNATTLVYRLSFSESVTGVNLADFTLLLTGTASGILSSVSAGSGTFMDITITGVGGNGSLRLHLNSSGTGIADNAGNAISGGFNGQAYTIDNAPPVVTGVVDKGVYATPVSISFNEGNGSLNGSFFGSGSVVSVDGAYILVVTDEAGNTTTINFTIDTTAPSGTVLINGGAARTNTASVTLTVTASSATQMRFSNDNSTYSAWEPVTSSRTWGLSTPDGLKTVYMQLRDGAGNISPVFTDNIDFDGTPPVLTISSPAGSVTTTSPIPLTFVFSEAITGFNAGSIGLSSGTLSGFSGSGASYSAVLTPAGNGPVTVSIAAGAGQDAAANDNLAAAFTVEYSSFVGWTGNTSSAWNLPANWWGGIVPGAGENVVIPAGLARYPVLSSGTITVRSMTIEAGAVFGQSGGTLDVKGDFVNHGTLNARGGLIQLSGPARQTIGGASTSRFFDLTVGPQGVIQATPAAVRHVLQLNGVLLTDGFPLTLISDNSGTAMVVNNGGVVSGNATVQRYIDPTLNAGLGYRHYSSPVVGATVGSLATAGFAPVVNEAYNTAANPGAVNPFPTVFGYNESRLTAASATTRAFDFGWESPAALGSALVRGRGYTVNVPATATVSLVGSLNNGPVTVTGLGRGETTSSGWHLLGNPYAAPIDWDLLTKPTGMLPTVYVYRSGTQYGGGYATYLNGIGDLTDGVIPAMQAFFVRTTQPVSSFEFTNAARLTSYANPVFRRGTAEQRPVLQLAATNPTGQKDVTFVYLETGATAGFDAAYDAPKLLNGLVRCYTLTPAEEALAINGLGSVGTPQSLPLVVEGVAGNWQFDVEALLNAGQLTVELEDRVLGTRQVLTSGRRYAFAHSGGQNKTRFVLHLNAGRVTVQQGPGAGPAVEVFPNPTNQEHGVKVRASGLSAPELTISLYNSLGQLVQTQTVRTTQGSAEAVLATRSLAAGVYTLQLRHAQGQTVKKLLIN